MSLIFLVLLPFLGSLVAAVLPANARNTESTLAGVIALVCAVQAALYFPAVADGGVLRQEWRGLKVPGHVDEVLKAVKSLNALKKAA